MPSKSPSRRIETPNPCDRCYSPCEIDRSETLCPSDLEHPQPLDLPRQTAFDLFQPFSISGTKTGFDSRRLHQIT